jgi:hypothetical protein
MTIKVKKLSNLEGTVVTGTVLSRLVDADPH